MAPEYPPPYDVAETKQAQSQGVEAKTGSACLKWFVFLLILLVIGVSLWWFYFREKKEKTPPKEPAQKEKNVIDEEGGVVTQAGVKIIIPKGALDREVKISVEKVREGRVTALYHLKPDGLVFRKQVTVKVPYNEEKLYTWETAYMISLYTGENANYVTDKKLTSVDVSERKVSTELARF